MSKKQKPVTAKEVLNNVLNTKPVDSVNKPPHYNLGKIECIDAIDTVTESLPGKSGYYTGTIIKYVWRWFFKNGIEDLKKARWYLNRLIEQAESDNSTKL